MTVSHSTFLTTFVTFELCSVTLHASEVTLAVKNVEQATAWERG